MAVSRPETVLNGIQLGVFASRLDAVCDEMGAVLRRAAFSPNIKDRLDFSCAVFDADGQLCAQAAHIPVHLGSMAYAMSGLVNQTSWQAGDMLVLNDPFMGGTHLPDVTLIAPVFVDESLQGFVANRAHHANIGGDCPGSMPLSTHLSEEGIVIEPVHLIRSGQLQQQVWQRITSVQDEQGFSGGDFAAQISANRTGVERLQALISRQSIAWFREGLSQLNQYAERLARAELKKIPAGQYSFSDVMDDDGAGNCDIPIKVTIRVEDGSVIVDFTGSAMQVPGNINCPLPVAAAAVYYVFRCLMPSYAPACAGLFKSIKIVVEKGSLLDAQRPAAVAAGNVETSTRIVDVILGALAQAMPERIPAASQGTMNNIAMGYRQVQPEQPDKRAWDYYETIAGGMGAGSSSAGLHAVHSHMTNTLNTPVESLEMHYPLRIRRYQIRRDSGGDGAHPGGNGLLREFEFLTDTSVTILSERRRHRAWGLAGGEPGLCGENWYNGIELAGKCQIQAKSGDHLLIATPGGGGYGKKNH